MRGRLCLVTGGTSGIGSAIVKALAGMGAHVIMTGRDRSKGKALIDHVMATGSPGTLELITVDFTSLAAVRQLASEIHERWNRLDVLVNNAGVWLLDRQTTIDGFEMHFAVNHLAHFLLTNLLLDLLKNSPSARVITVASDGHKRGRIDFSNLQLKRNYSAAAGYCNSKLANVLFSNELARRLAATSVTSNSLHPGIVNTDLVRGTRGPWLWLWKLLTPLQQTPGQGARTAVYLASSPEVEGITGRYYGKCREERPAQAALDMDMAKKLWDESMRLCSLAS